MAYGGGSRQYDYVENWPQLPDGETFGQVVEIVVDSQDRVFIFHRGATSPLIFNSGGEYLGTWEKNEHWQDIHGVTIGQDDSGEYLIVVDRDRHLVSRADLEGNVQWTAGTPDQLGQNGDPFDKPTDSGIAPNGDIYVADGYGNNRVHQFTASGELVRSWGERGVSQGQFILPHAARVIDRNGEPTVYVCDRQNHRIQLFTLDGQYIRKLTGVRQPCDIIADSEGVRYVAELQGRVAIFNEHDFLITRVGGEQKVEAGHFIAPHTVAIDSEGSMYVGEVLQGARVSKYSRVAGD